ncbi:hypothetical protein U1Q18_043578 [Sarracenia purpurea var. burkii]
MGKRLPPSGFLVMKGGLQAKNRTRRFFWSAISLAAEICISAARSDVFFSRISFGFVVVIFVIEGDDEPESESEGSDLESEDVETEGDLGEVTSHKGLPPIPVALSSPKETQGVNDVNEALSLIGSNFVPVLEGDYEVAGKNPVGPHSVSEKEGKLELVTPAVAEKERALRLPTLVNELSFEGSFGAGGEVFPSGQILEQSVGPRHRLDAALCVSFQSHGVNEVWAWVGTVEKDDFTLLLLYRP